MREADLIRLRHMLDAAKEAIEFAEDRSQADQDDLPTLISELELIVKSEKEE